MAKALAQLNTPRWIQLVKQYSTYAVPIGVVSLLGVIIVPMHPRVMDILIAMNLALSAIILLTTVYIESPLEFSVFPSLLLTTTLFRLVLNVASTRLILSADATDPSQVVGVAGDVIQAFGNFVAGGSVVVGVIIFVILIVVQFVVITKGATRISEVAARFTLDGMPGKQMAIDADLNAGTINEGEARRRREQVTQEADFYGAMDGASKFVRGDAIAGIIITLINVIGGFAVGVFDKGWPAADTLGSFTKLTIGDGLVSQIPAFIISIAAGLIVTRSSSNNDLGTELSDQLTSQPVALAMTAMFLGLLAFTGLPAVPMLALSAGVGSVAFYLMRNDKADRQVNEAEKKAKEAEAAAPPPVEKLLTVDTLELEIGYGLVRLVDAKQGGDLLDRISMLRRQMAVELGLVVPPVRIRDNMQLQPHDYHIKVRGNTVASGTAYPGKFLAMQTGMADTHSDPLDGVHTREPAFGLDAWWVEPALKQRAETLNYTVVDATTMLATHLTEVVKNHAAELLSREETNNLVTQLKEKSPKLVEEVIGEQIKPGELQRVLQNLLRERVPVRDLETIVETLSEWAGRTKDLDVLTEYARNALRRTICNQYIETDVETGAGRLFCVTLDPSLEDLINGYIERGTGGTTMTMPPAIANRITSAMIGEIQKLITTGHHPLVLASPQVRAQVRGLLEQSIPNIAVMGYNEVSKGVEVESVGLVQVELAPEPTISTSNRLQGSLS
ncbi:MAG: flagellar biosynthesis protein FlhA [Planctomycetes bacterium]|nr:flagellar biosynthesis protein FlhA [Planctomycetota bacterium]